jgi:hypothetical protein
MTAVALRPATPADSEFCFELHEAAMGGYITALWGWDGQRQREFQTVPSPPAAGRSSPPTGRTSA